MPSRPIALFGLTGGLASGKSTVAAHWRSRGLPVIDADALAREVTAPGSPLVDAIVAEFGPQAANAGALDRKWLARQVFGSADKRARLEALVHPQVQARRDALLAELEARGEPLVCYEVPLLFEKGLEQELRPVVVVSVPESMQVARACARDAASEADVRARLAAQLPLSEKVRRADYVIDNTGTLEHARQSADEVLRRVCADLGVDPARYGCTFAADLP